MSTATAKPRAHKPSASAPAGGSTLAEKADRHACYELAVQNPEFEIDFIAETFKKLTGREARVMREDFSGTSISSVEWVKRHRQNRAIAIDIDQEVLDWGRERHVSRLSNDQRKRIEMILADVREVKTEKVDVIQAYNFSYWFFQERQMMLDYFRSLYDSLVDDGVLFLDIFGGSECYQVQKEKRKVDDADFKYIWDQYEFNAITNELKCAIHFHFADKSKMKNAFTYTWRVWGARELREILADAGFSESTIYRQEFDDETDEALDEYIATDEAEDYACWLGYLVARK